jgi:protocatechuate 3,4-dioxygenase beta subunit
VMDEQRLTRRSSLLRFGGLVAGALVAKGVTLDNAAGVGPAGVASGAVTCVLTPELTQGPFYVPNERVRRDVTEGKPGTPLALALTVVDAATCKPIKGAAVDIWHCDASGTYSGVSAQNTVDKTFLRGVQRTDAKGVAHFKTIYPGWYPGRDVHIHVMVHLGGRIVHTGQLFFPDALTDKVYKAAPYAKRGARDTRNADDSIFVNGGSKSILALHKQAAGYRASLVMGVQR